MNPTRKKLFELSHPLGNVRSVIADVKLNESLAGGGMEQRAEIVMSSDYYPFGMTIGETHVESEGYRYGFNGMEQDDEVSGEGNSYDFGARMFDSRIARWASVDPHFINYPYLSDYSFAANSPNVIIDFDGNDIVIYYDGGSFRFTGDNVFDMPSSQFVESVVNAYLYNVGNGGGNAMKAAATNPDIIVTVSHTVDGSISDKNHVYWNPQRGILTENLDVLSPSTVMEHEFSHAMRYLLDPIGYQNDYFDPDPLHGNKEEKRVLEGDESFTAKCNGEISGDLSRTSRTLSTVFVSGDETSAEIDLEKSRSYYDQLDKEGYDVSYLLNRLSTYEAQN